MAKVTQEQRSAGLPQLKPDKFGGAELLVGTIAGVTFKKSQFRASDQPVIAFKEYPEYELRLGKRSTDRLCEKFGDESDDWIGEKVPLIKAREEVGKNVYVVYQVPPVEEWAAAFKRAKRS